MAETLPGAGGRLSGGPEPRGRAAAPRPPGPAGPGPAGPPGPSGPPDLFEERQFRWPEQPGDPEKESKLPWFWFLDVGEARLYLILFTTVNLLWMGTALSVWLFHSVVLWIVFTVPMTITWLAYLRVWFRLCKRVRPPLERRQWLWANWLNPHVRHALQMARELIADR